MKQKDITEKLLESYNDVFADIVNVLLFDGRQVIKENELEDQTPRAVYKEGMTLRETERYIAKRWKNGEVRLACIGMENQTKPDKDMPLRVIAYDGAVYRSQLNQTDSNRRYPVVTLVLYYGTDKHWDKSPSLKETLEIPEEFEPFVSDYKINVFEIAFMEREKANLFKSDFKIVADYFIQMRETGTYTGSKENIVHVDEILKLLSVMTGDNRFEDAMGTEDNEKGKVKNMCEALDRIVQKGFEQGRMQGIEQGRMQGIEQGRICSISSLLENGMNESEVTRLLKATPEEIQKAKELM